MMQGGGQNEWFYKDPQGQKRGPFTSDQMYAWFKEGYFNEDLMIAFNENAMFFPLKRFTQQIM